MAYEEEKQEGCNCVNYNCKFYDKSFEQNCSAGDEDDNPVVLECDRYSPEHDGH